MKKLVLGFGLCFSLIAGACPSGIRCLAGVVAIVGLTIAGCTNNTPPPNPGPYYAPPGSNSSYSSSYEYSSETKDGQTTESFSGEITEDGKTRKYDNVGDYEQDSRPFPPFSPPPIPGRPQ